MNSSQRRYTAHEVERMRKAMTAIPDERTISYGYGGISATALILKRMAEKTVIEERLRTAMLAGVAPGDLEHQTDKLARQIIKEWDEMPKPENCFPPLFVADAERWFQARGLVIPCE